MANLNYNVNVETSQGIQALNTLQQRVSVLNTGFDRLKTAIAGLAIGAAITNAIKFADAIQDLSDSTGIAVANIVGFGKALQNFGGNSETAEKGILRLVTNIGAAAEGSASLQAAFARVGVTLEDLATLSEQEILAKVISGLGDVDDKSEQAFLKTQLLGKEFRNISVRGQELATAYAASSQAAQANAASITAASDAYDRFEKSIAAVTDGILIAITPVTEFFAKLEPEKIQNFANSLVKLAVTVGSLFVIGKIVGLVGALGAALGFAAVPAVAFALAFGKVLALGALLIGALGAVNAGLKLAFNIDLLKPFTTAFSFIVDKFSKFKELLGFKPADISKDLDKNTEAALKNADGLDKTAKTLREVKDPFEQLKQSITGVSDEYARLNKINIDNIQNQTALIGKSREEQEVIKARTDLMRKEAEEIAKLEDRRSRLTEEQSKAGIGKIIDEQIAKVREQTKVDLESTEAAVRNSQNRVRAFDLEKFSRQSIIDVEKQIRDVQFEIATITMTEMEKKSAQIKRDAFERAEAEIKAQEASRGSLLTEAEKQKYYDAANKRVNDLIKSQERLNTQSRTFSTGWKRAFNDYVQNATNAARVAEQMFKKFTSGIEDAFVNFVKTGKFEWRSFVQDMLETLLRSQIQQTLAGLFKGMGGASGGMLGGLGDILGAAFGGTQAPGSSPQNPMYVIDLTGGGTGGGVFGQAGGIFGGQQQQQQQGGGILGTLGNVVSGIGSSIGGAFSGVVDAVSSVGSGIWDTVSSIGSSIGDLFGGFFANGGMIPANKFGIVGERGPEFIGGPANITPMMGGAVTYNINAVDAASFKALVASDPGFIHAVAMQGAMSVPGRR